MENRGLWPMLHFPGLLVMNYGAWTIKNEVIKSFRSLSLDFDTILPENPQDYDNLQPPKEQGKATVVRFHVTVLSLDTIDEGSMTYVADIFMSQSWKDHRLQLPENMTTKYRLLPISWLKKMWRPDSFFKNAKKVTFQEMTIPNHYIWLYSDKTILYMVKLTLLLSCAMKFESYPHDTQVCTMKIESLSYTTDDLIFDWEEIVPLEVDDAIELPQHNLVETRLGDCTQEYSTGNVHTNLMSPISYRRKNCCKYHKNFSLGFFSIIRVSSIIEVEPCRILVIEVVLKPTVIEDVMKLPVIEDVLKKILVIKVIIEATCHLRCPG
ncbi:glycine receptor subunit alpha-3-like, partial [Stegodyphus dumicola]|uniref:glycine receptor subunit alpha-3-like n=1 Tax=Stegodyphus dumicola TaxID=202533 RepID=UPI0015AD272D